MFNIKLLHNRKLFAAWRNKDGLSVIFCDVSILKNANITFVIEDVNKITKTTLEMYNVNYT